MTPKYVLNFVWEAKVIKAPSGFELMAHGFVTNPLTHGALLGNNFWEEKNIKLYLILKFISIESVSQHGYVTFYLNGLV